MGNGERRERTPQDVARHIADTVNSASAFFEAEMRQDGRLDVYTRDGERFLVTVTRWEA